MAMYDYVTPLGLIVPDTAELLADVESEWREAFGADLVLTNETPQGVLVAAEVQARDAVVRNNASLANQNMNPDIMEGVFIDAIWRLTRGSRRGASRSLIIGAIAAGQPGTIILAGSLAAVEGTGELFATVGVSTIGVGGTVILNLQSVNFGPVGAAAGQLRNVATSILGWETITNPSAAILGRLAESDIQARRRRRQTLALQGVALPEAITSRLYDVDGVNSVAFRENITNDILVIDGVTLKPHSIYVAVDGGTDADIAYALLSTKSLGAGWNGDTAVDIIEAASGQPYAVQFQRAAAVPLYARIRAKFNNLDAPSIVTGAIMAYSRGELEGDAGFVINGDVSPFELAGAVNQVEPRIFVTSVELSTDGTNYSAAVVPIDITQIPTIAPGSITVLPA